MYKVYVVCHNDTAVEVAKKNIHNTNLEILRVSDKSPYFETQAFEKLESIEDEWKDMDYVGLITYSFFDKMKDAKVDFDQIVSKCSADVCPIFGIDFYKPRAQSAVSFIESISFQHGPFIWHILYNILKTIGRYTDDQIFDKSMKGFISNWWLAKPQWLKRYCMFVKRAIKYLEANKTLSTMVKEQSYYTGFKVENRDTLDTEKLLGIFGRPYYTLEPFLFERLPVLFFHIEQANIASSPYKALFALLD